MSTRIEWATHTWNPLVGCARVSPGCDHCYAATFTRRKLTAAHAEASPWDGRIVLRPETLDEPLSWKKPRRMFVGSMTDLFHHDVPLRFILDLWSTMARCPQHTFMILTKRPSRMRRIVDKLCWSEQDFAYIDGHPDVDDEIPDDAWGEEPLPNVWLGVSVENQRYADMRIPKLLDTPAAVRFVSAEPLLGPVDLSRYVAGEEPIYDLHMGETFTVRPEGPRLDWVITGGETGAGSRPSHPAWFRAIRDLCADAEVPYFHKQNGDWAAGPTGTHRISWDGTVTYPNPPTCVMSDEELITRVGKPRAGRLLDGRTHDAIPDAAA